MTGFLLTLGFIAAVLIGARCFALYIARISEGHRPRPASDDELYGLAHGDWPKVPAVNDVFHFGTDITEA
jgi:hypothetical protein